MILLSSIKPNPNNPRVIKDKKFKQLVQSIKDFPEMMAKRPIVVDENKMSLGGNQRLKVLQELGYKEIPDEWVSSASDWTEDQKREFIIKDNVSFGEHDFDILTNDWDVDQLEHWGLEVPGSEQDDTKPKEVELVPYHKTHILLSFPPEKMIEIQPLLQQICAFSFVEYEQSNN